MRSDDWFESLYDAHRSALGAYCRRRLPGDLVDDVMAEIFLTAWRRRAQIPAGSELPWLYGVARNVVANQRRGIGRRRRLAARILSHSSERRAARDVETSTDGPVEILEALASLSSSDQEVLRLRAWEELTTAEIAIVLGITSAAVDMRLSRAKRRLERAFASATQIGPAEVSPLMNGEAS